MSPACFRNDTVEQRQLPPGLLRRLPKGIWLGIGLLLASLIGIGLVTSSPAGTAPTQTPNDPSAGRRAYALGHVAVEGGLTPLHPLQPGQVVHVEVHEGEEVEEGAPLIYLDDRLALAQIREAEAALGEAQARLAQAKNLPKQLQAKIEAQQAAVEGEQKKLAAARTRLAQARRLFENKAGPVEDVRFAEDTVQAQEKAVEAEQAKLRLLKLTDPAEEIKRAEEDVAAKEAQLDKARLALRHCTVWAPAKGTVLRINASDGQALGSEARQPAIIFAPNKPRIIEAEVEQEFAGRVAVGQKARIEDDTTGKGSWTGRVRRISDWFAHRRSMLLEPLQLNDVRTLEVIIDLDPGQEPLRIGQRVRVHLVGAE
jgi:HlyD family secretion protein